MTEERLQDHRLPFDDLNMALRVVCDDRDPNNGNASHGYSVLLADPNVAHDRSVADIAFQHGPRGDPDAVEGCTDQVLLTILLDRYRGFQSGKFACRENAIVITKLEEALMWMQKRAMDRHRRGVLGKHES